MIRYNVPKDMLSVAQKRVRDFLHPSITSTETMERIMQSIYLQGIIDATEAQQNQEEE